MAISVLAAARLLPAGAEPVVALGELALDGGIRPVRGGLGAALVAWSLGRPCFLLPESAAEAASLDGVDIRPVASLADAAGATDAVGVLVGYLCSAESPWREIKGMSS